MKVGRVTPFLVNGGTGQKNALFVKVETEDGLHGWGECFTTMSRDKAVEQHVLEIARYLVGRSVFGIKHFNQVMYYELVGMRGSLDFYAAMSGLEQALWDIIGKALNQPVYNLLGGACRPRIRVYANGWADGSSPPEVVAERAVAMVQRGFTAIKWDPFPNPRRTFLTKREEQSAIESVRAVREAVGPDVDLLLDIHRRLAPTHALKVAKEIEQYDLFWYEEPITPRNLDELAALRRLTTMPIVAGEDLFTKYDFREVLEKRCADVINPDVMLCGGILALKELAAMAEPYDVSVSPHGWGVAVGLAATIQASAVMTNYLITDYFVGLESVTQAIAKTPFTVEGGYIELPTAPGLGFDLDEAAMAEHPYKQLPLRPYRTYEQEGP